MIFILNFDITFAQVPQGIPYQAVARNGQGQPLASTNVKVRFSVLDSIATGNAVYVESHSTTTSALGLFTANVGMGTASTGTFSSINWGQNFKFLKVELDTTATGNSYIDLGTQQMMSVPYSKYSETTSFNFSETGDTLKIGNEFLIVPGISEANGDGDYGVDSLSCGAQGILNPSKKYGTVTDVDGNSYRTIILGMQKWMAENLKVSHYNNGDDIPNVTVDSLWSSQTQGAYCWFLNDSAINDCLFGKIYNGFVINDNRNVCPVGWRIPNKNDMLMIRKFLGTSIRSSIRSTKSWYQVADDFIYPDNSSGFSLMAGCWRSETGYFQPSLLNSIEDSSNYMGSPIKHDHAGLWLKSGNNFEAVRIECLGSFYISDWEVLPQNGFSIRCLKD